MLIFLPKEKTAEPGIDIEKFNDLKSSLHKTDINVFLPKFTFNTKYGLKEQLSDLGMPTAFSSEADFSGMDGSKNLFISNVVHQAFVEVNEEGTEAAAATGVTMEVTSLPAPKPEFRANHPFLFVVQEKETGNILFLGRVNNPVKA